MSYIPTGDRNYMACLRRVMTSAWWGQPITGIAKPPIALNNETVAAVNAAGTGEVDMFKVDGSNVFQLVNGATIPTGKALTFASGATLSGAGIVTSANLDPAIEQYSATIPLTAAQIITLHSAPVTLIAAPGAGKYIIVWGLVFQITTTSTQFTGGGVVAPVYHGATAALTANTIPAATVTAVAGTTTTLIAAGSPASGLVLTANTGIDLYAATADFAAGTGTANVRVWYSVVTP